MKIHLNLIITILLLSSINCYINPVQGVGNSPDPGVVYDGKYFYAATTGGSNGN